MWYLKHESVDAKLRFERAPLCYLAKRKDKSCERIVNDGLLNDEGIIEYAERVMSAGDELVYRSYSEGLDFVN